MRLPVSSEMRYAPNDRRAQGATERRPAMKKTITVQAFKSEIFKAQKLTIGLDLACSKGAADHQKQSKR
jgi:hypothetical protein